MKHSESPREISVTDKGHITILKYEAKRLRLIIALWLATTCSVAAVIFLISRL